MRILLVNKFHYRKGGAETYYLTVGSELERMGHEVAYFSMRHPDNLPCEWDKYFVTQREYNNVKDPLKAARDGMALIYSPEAKRNFQALCEEFRPDVVHLNNVHRQITLSILDAPYLGENKVPVFYTAHDYVTVCPGYLMLDGGGRVCDACLEDGRYRHCIENRCVKGSRAKSALAAMEASFNRAHKSNRRIDRVIAPSRFMRSKLIEGGWPEGKVVFLQNFADDAILDRAANAGADATDRENPYLLFFGRLSAEKGVDTLLRAFDAALPSLPQNMRLVVVGDGPDAADFKTLASSLGCAARIEFAGYQTGGALQAYVEMAREHAVLDRGGFCCRHACHRHGYRRNPRVGRRMENGIRLRARGRPVDGRCYIARHECVLGSVRLLDAAAQLPLLRHGKLLAREVYERSREPI